MVTTESQRLSELHHSHIYSVDFVISFATNAWVVKQVTSLATRLKTSVRIGTMREDVHDGAVMSNKPFERSAQILRVVVYGEPRNESTWLDPCRREQHRLSTSQWDYAYWWSLTVTHYRNAH